MNIHKLVIAMALVVPLLAASAAHAHDASLHKGKPTEGEIVSLDGEHLKLKTESGMKAVTLGSDTRVEVDDRPGKTDDLKSGDHVAVFGTTLESGELVAKEVVRHSDSEGDSHERHAMGDSKRMPGHEDPTAEEQEKKLDDYHKAHPH